MFDCGRERRPLALRARVERSYTANDLGVVDARRGKGNAGLGQVELRKAQRLAPLRRRHIASGGISGVNGVGGTNKNRP